MKTVLGIETTCDETAAAVVSLDPDGAPVIPRQRGAEPDRRARGLWRRRAGDRRPRHVEVLDRLIARALERARDAPFRPRRHRRRGGAGADRRRAGRPRHRQDPGAGGEQAAAGGQPSRSPRPHRPADGRARLPLPAAARLPGTRSSSPCAASAITCASAAPSTTPSARPSTRPPSSSASAIPAARGGAHGRVGDPERFALPRRCSGGGRPILPLRPQDALRIEAERTAPWPSATWPTSAPASRRRWSMW